MMMHSAGGDPSAKARQARPPAQGQWGDMRATGGSEDMSVGGSAPDPALAHAHTLHTRVPSLGVDSFAASPMNGKGAAAASSLEANSVGEVDAENRGCGDPFTQEGNHIADTCDYADIEMFLSRCASAASPPGAQLGQFDNTSNRTPLKSCERSAGVVAVR